MEFIPQIAEKGTLGLFLALSLLANIALFRENRQLAKDKVDLVEKRVQDIKDLTSIHTTALDKMRELDDQKQEKTKEILNTILSIVMSLKERIPLK